MQRCLLRIAKEGLHRSVASCSECKTIIGTRGMGWTSRVEQEKRQERNSEMRGRNRGDRQAKQRAEEGQLTLLIEEKYNSIPPIARNKESFMAIIKLYKDYKGRNHADFITASMKYMKEYGVHKDLDAYKALLQVFPKEKMMPINLWQRMFMHYPHQQQTCVKLLDEMEWFGVQPDKEVHDIVVSVFGDWNYATKKAKRMLYWMPKLKNANKYLDRRHVEGRDLSAAELAGIALKMMNRDPGAEHSLVTLSDIEVEAAEHPAWICFSQSFIQRNLINELPDDYEVILSGPFLVYVMSYQVQYVTLTCKPLRKFAIADEFKKDNTFEENYSKWFEEWEERQMSRGRSVHEQQSETILALGALYNNNNETGKRWIAELEKSNPKLAKLRVRLRVEGVKHV